MMKKKKQHLRINKLTIGAGLFGAGLLAGLMYRTGENKALREMNKTLFRESEKKTWFLGKQFAELIRKTRT